MSYKAVARQSYGQRKRLRHTAITPSHHFSFKADWEANLEKAIAEAQKFKDQGYLVDEGIEKGAFMESQANRVAKRLKDMGCETQLIPVARWAGENVVFIIYKPPKELQAPPSPKPKASPKIETEKVYERFLKTFWSKTSEKPDPQEFANKGYVIDPGKYVALIAPNAPSAESLVKMLRDEQAKGTGICVFENTPKFQVTTTKNKNAGSRFVVFDMQGKIGARIRYFREALKVLGKGKIKVFSPGASIPVYLVREDGHAIAIAPPTDLDVTKAVTINSLVMQSQNM